MKGTRRNALKFSGHGHRPANWSQIKPEYIKGNGPWLTSYLGLPCLTIQFGVIERVTTFKLLGITLSNDLILGSSHKRYLCKSCSTAIIPETVETSWVTFWWLTHIGYFYLPVIWPVLEYGCAVWHHGLTAAQFQKLESLQKMTLRIIREIVYVSSTPLCYVSGLTVDNHVQQFRAATSYNINITLPGYWHDNVVCLSVCDAVYCG